MRNSCFYLIRSRPAGHFVHWFNASGSVRQTLFNSLILMTMADLHRAGSYDRMSDDVLTRTAPQLGAHRPPSHLSPLLLVGRRALTGSRPRPANLVEASRIQILSISFAEHQQPLPPNQAMSQTDAYGIRAGKWRGSDEKPECRPVSMSGYGSAREQQRQH